MFLAAAADNVNPNRISWKFYWDLPCLRTAICYGQNDHSCDCGAIRRPRNHGAKRKIAFHDSKITRLYNRLLKSYPEKFFRITMDGGYEELVSPKQVQNNYSTYSQYEKEPISLKVHSGYLFTNDLTAST